MEYINGKLVVDEIILDPNLNQHIVIRIDTKFYALRSARAGEQQVTEKDLSPYKKQVANEWYRPSGSFQFMTHGLIPRGGYHVEIGRPVTEAEFSDIVARYELTEDDISDEFTDSRGELFGKDYSVSFVSQQIRLKTSEETLTLERELRNKGIEASSGSPGRINIRVEPVPVK